MVVSEEDVPNSTTTEESSDGMVDSLKLDYNFSTEEKSDIYNENNDTTSPKEIQIPFKDGIETGLQILYTSMKLRNFPIKEDNLPMHDEIIEHISLNNCNLNIGTRVLPNVGVKILGYKKFKLIEFRTREFKIGLSIGLFDGNTIKKLDDYFSYEIYSKLKNVRVDAVAEIMKSIFAGELITFKIKDLYGEIRFENPIQVRKFDLIIESLQKYEECSKLINTSKIKNFSESSLEFYILHLLYSCLKEETSIDSWLNFRVTNTYGVKPNDKISFVKLHELDIRGFNYNLEECITVKSPLSEREINTEKNIISGYRKMVNIKLRLIEK